VSQNIFLSENKR